MELNFNYPSELVGKNPFYSAIYLALHKEEETGSLKWGLAGRIPSVVSSSILIQTSREHTTEIVNLCTYIPIARIKEDCVTPRKCIPVHLKTKRCWRPDHALLKLHRKSFVFLPRKHLFAPWVYHWTYH